MLNWRKKLNKIKKNYFTFADLRKIADLEDASLRVAVSRMIKAGEIIKLAKGYYRFSEVVLDMPKIALEIYAPSYLSFEWALGQVGILSQKSYSLTLATTKRAKQISLDETNIIYRHLQEDLFFGYVLEGEYLMAEKEKAFLDLAYLSLNGYASFDAQEMNLELLDKKKVREYLERFRSGRLKKLIEEVLLS